MNKIIVSIALTVLAVIVLSFLLPWWHAMTAGLIAGLYVPVKRGWAFFGPFLGGALGWTILALFPAMSNDFLMAGRIAELLPLNGNVGLLFLVTALIGGLCAGTTGVLGNVLRGFLHTAPGKTA